MKKKNYLHSVLLVIHADEHALIVELQVEVVRQADVVAIALLIDFRNNAAREVGLHILHNRGGNDAGGNLVQMAIHFLPRAFAVELNLRSVVQAALVQVPVLFGEHNLLLREVGLHEGFSCVGQLIYWNGFLYGHGRVGNHKTQECREENFYLFHNLLLY